MKNIFQFRMEFSGVRPILLLACLLAPWQSIVAQSAPTFATDVAPILYEKCCQLP